MPAIANRDSPPQKPGTASRFQKASGLFADENLDLLSHVLDDWFRIPGTSIRFGVDGIIGLVPGLGDILGGLASTIIVFAAWVRGVPYITLLRMWLTSASKSCWARFLWSAMLLTLRGRRTGATMR